MKQLGPLLPLIVSAVVGGAVGSAVTLFVGRPDAPTRKHASPTREAPVAREAEPSREDPGDNTAERLRSLESRVSLLTAALTKGGTPLPQPTGKEGSSAAAQGAPEDVASPVFEAAVRDIVDRVDEERREERQNRRGAFVEQTSHEVSDRLGDKLGLRDDQRQKIADIVKQAFESMGAVRDLPPEQRPKTPAEWRRQRDGQQQKIKDALREVLTPAQMQAYEELPEEDQIAGRRSMRGRRGAGP